MLVHMADQLGKLQPGIPQVMAEQLSFILAYRVRSPEFEVTEARVLVLNDRLGSAMRIGQVISKEESWCRCEDVFGFIVPVRRDHSDERAEGGFDGRGELCNL